jgi:hypothetical protein
VISNGRQETPGGAISEVEPAIRTSSIITDRTAGCIDARETGTPQQSVRSFDADQKMAAVAIFRAEPGRKCRCTSGEPALLFSVQPDRAMSRLDLGRELGLRRWARANYVPPEQRSATWHPVVISEMLARDGELADQSAPSHGAQRYVPLMPTPFAGSEFCGP